ncbi:MAG: hypothetical protein EBV64_14380 [Oxalobacteraceae bacterium]|nr:hypothetical protein [Oxalobacteraceae bacterium]
MKVATRCAFTDLSFFSGNAFVQVAQLIHINRHGSQGFNRGIYIRQRCRFADYPIAVIQSAADVHLTGRKNQGLIGIAYFLGSDFQTIVCSDERYRIRMSCVTQALRADGHITSRDAASGKVIDLRRTQDDLICI